MLANITRVSGGWVVKAPQIGVSRIDRDELRRFISEKYGEVATHPELGFHFHTGRPLALMLGYPAELLDRLPVSNLTSFAGTGNPFLFGDLRAAERVVDVGCGAGVDTLIAAQQVGPSGQVVAVDMTAEMREKTQAGAREMELSNVDVREGFAEALPVDDSFADVLISNGVVNLCPDKRAVFREMLRVLKPGGRVQIGDILVHKEVPQDAKDDIALWSG
jgi:SAM-dependent methyltransferase